MEELSSNSHKSRQETEPAEKKVDKVIKGEAKVRKKNEILKFADVFFAEDIQNIKSYIIKDVLVPSFKKALSDIIKNGSDMILYGESGSRERKASPASRVSYRSYYSNPRDDEPRRNTYSSRARDRYQYDDIQVETRSEAEEILSGMDDLIATYGMVSILEMYDLAGITSSRYTDNKYGWTDISRAEISRVRDGYVIRMPRAMPLD